MIIRIFINKLKKILKLLNKYKINKDLNLTIDNAKPPIFWKEKEITKQQIQRWKPNEIEKLIYDVNAIELLIKTSSLNSINLVSDFYNRKIDLIIIFYNINYFI